MSQHFRSKWKDCHENFNINNMVHILLSLCFTACFFLHVQVDRSAKPYKNLQLYEMLVELMKDEENVELQIRDSEKAVLQFTSTTTNVFV